LATKKSYSRRANSKRKIKKSWTTRILLFTIGLLVFLIVAFTVYQFRDGIMYYLGFKTHKNVNALSKEERKIADIRIYEVLSKHTDKVIGFDVSQYQGNIQWEAIRKIEDTFQLQFVFVRATAGINKVDSQFKENWKQAKKNQFIRGAYHYYRPNENSIQQAENFIQTVNLEPGDFPPVLDIEQLPKKQSLDSLKVGLKRWLTRVEKHYKVKPIIYSGESYYNDFLKKEFSDYPFWIANYNFWRNQPEMNWLLWQFTEKAQVSGIKGTVDVNIFNGNLIYLRSKLVD
jgi:lysozyme